MKVVFREMLCKEFLILCLVLTFSRLVFTERQDFCQSFADNDFNIGYGYQTDYWTQHFLVIGSDYWQIEWDEDRARLVSSLSKTSDFLSNELRTAFLSNFSSDGKRMGYSLTGRLYRHNNTIEWMSIRFNRTTGQLVKIGTTEDYSVNRTDIGFEQDFNPSVSLVASLGTICFLQQKPVLNQKPIVFENTYRCFQFDYLTGSADNADNRVVEDLKTTMDRKNIAYESNVTSLTHVRDSRQVIAILSEFHFSDIRYLFLFKDNKSITYCLSSFVHFNKGCETYPEVLISCSDYEKTTTRISDKPSIQKSSKPVSNEMKGTPDWKSILFRHRDMALLIFASILLFVFSSLLMRRTKTQN